MNNFTQDIGVVLKQINLGVASKIVALGVNFTDGFYVPIAVGDNVWLFGDGQVMLFGDGSEIIWA